MELERGHNITEITIYHTNWKKKDNLEAMFLNLKVVEN